MRQGEQGSPSRYCGSFSAARKPTVNCHRLINDSNDETLIGVVAGIEQFRSIAKTS